MFKIIEHTADIGIEAYGKTLEEAFENAAKGMFSLMIGDGKIESKVMKEVEVPFDMDEEQLLVDWLSELLYIHDVEHLVFGEFDVKIGKEKLTGRAYGEEYDVKKHGYGMEIKAVTYHMLEVKKDKKGYVVRCLFDI
jgi:SHS2 domain-containing protein